MDDLQRLAQKASKVQIPIDVLKFVDDVKNPDIFLQETLDAAIVANQVSAGKIAGLTVSAQFEVRLT